MKLLITCPRKLLLADSVSGDVQLVESNRPEYYGISWAEEGRALCLGHSGIENARLGTLQSYMDSERGWVSCGRRDGPRSLSMAHQVLCAGNRIIATNTGRNCITLFRTDDWYYRHFWIDDIRWDRKGRENSCGSHFNSIFLREDQLYVVAHNHDRGSSIVRMSWPELEVLGVDSTTTHMAHNVWVTDEGQVIVCDSMRGTLVDVASQSVVWKCDLPEVVTRGLASDGEYVFVGHSAIGTREARVNRDSRIWIVERSTWKTVGSISLPGSGNVHEVRILDRPDLCHHGHVFRGQIKTLGPAHPHRAAMPASPASSVAVSATTGQSTNPSMGRVADERRFEASDRWEQHVAFSKIVGRRATAADFSLATLTGFQATDVTVQANVDVRGASARHAGVIARYQGPADNNMIVALIAKADRGYRIQLWRQHAGTWSCLRATTTRRGTGTLQLNLTGEEATVVLDGTTVLCAIITGPPQSGSVGMRSACGILDTLEAKSLDAASQGSQRKSA